MISDRPPSSCRKTPRGRTTLVVAALLSLLAIVFATTASARQGEDGVAQTAATSDVFIVQLKQDPVVAYDGSEVGYPATAVAPGRKLNRNDAKVKKYVAHLNDRHAAIANSVGATRIYDYDYVYNGFAAPLSSKQVAALGKNPDVLSVEQDQLGHVDTDNTPTFLGLDQPGTGLWAQLGGPGHAGENVVVGVLDTGIWPEHPSFSDQSDLGDRPGSSGNSLRVYGPPPSTWHGTCQSGELWSQDDCNAKLIGARYYLSGFGHFGVIQNDYKSARDADGHGSHTSSTAAGNYGVPASVLGSNLGNVSGMAPRARVAMYKVCWNGESGGCPNSDSVAAINDAVADGVDVINFSISGTLTNYLDAVEVSYLFARRAGVFVAASAGNSGPGASTVAHISPWLTSVAASTQNRSFTGTVTLGNSSSYTGVTLTGGLPSTGIVDAASAGNQLCFLGSLNPAVVTGKIVLCRRGTSARVEKSLAVKQAGGVGMVLYNVNNTQSLNTDNHYVPSLHINNTDGLAVKAYIAANGASATASLSGGTRTFGGGNTMADFSSRGPSIAGGGDILKPDVTAPGVNILAGNTPTAFLGAPGQLFQSISGTSMSSPHTAGLAALLINSHPSWSPAAVQSALMTTARQNLTKEDGATPADPFDFGAGHVNPNPANDPGLVYDAGFDDYRGFLRGQGLCTFCFGTSPAPIIKASDLNLASLAIGKLAGVQTITRRLTNVGPAGTYNVSVDAPAGIDVAVDPTSLTFAAGETKTYTVTFTRTTAPFNAYSFGSLTWSDGTHSARSPIAIKSVPLAAPSEISGTGTFGSKSFSITFGYTGSFSATPQGLQAAHTETRTLTDDPTNNFDTTNPQGNQGIQLHTFTIPVGTPVARFQTFGTVNPGDDLDMYVYRVVGTTRTLVGSSTGGTASEVVTLNNPTAGSYEVYIHGWEVQSGVSYTLYDWILNPAAAGNLSVSAPSSATLGASDTVTATWSGLTAATKYLGRISYSDGVSEIGGTIVRIDA